MNDDFIIDDAKIHLSASKNLIYRKRVEQRFREFIRFLQENELTTRQILADDQPINEELQIKKSDLTEIGFLLVKNAYHRWLKGIDNGKEISDVTILVSALTKLKAS